MTIRARHQRRTRDDNRALASWDFPVVGIPYEGRAELVTKYLNEGDPVLLIREPLNPHGANAIAVYIAQGKIGYVPSEYSAEMAPLLVMREHDGSWNFVCGDGAADTDAARESDLKTACFDCAREHDPSLAPLANMKPGCEATRDGPGSPWMRTDDRM